VATKKTKPKQLTMDRLGELAHKAYRKMGYQLITFGDGSMGVLRCPTKHIETMNWFQAYIGEELGLITIKEPPRCVTCKREKPDDGQATCHRRRCQIKPAI
jgi:hypothetical protein